MVLTPKLNIEVYGVQNNNNCHVHARVTRMSS